MGTCCDAFDKHWILFSSMWHLPRSRLSQGRTKGRPKFAKMVNFWILLGWLQKLTHVPLAMHPCYYWSYKVNESIAGTLLNVPLCTVSTNKSYSNANKTNNNYYFGWSHYRMKSRQNKIPVRTNSHQNESRFRSDGNSFWPVQTTSFCANDVIDVNDVISTGVVWRGCLSLTLVDLPHRRASTLYII